MSGPVRSYFTGLQNRSTRSEPCSRLKLSHERSQYRQALDKKPNLARVVTDTAANQTHDTSALDFTRSSSQVDLLDRKYEAVDRANSRQDSICSMSSSTFNTPVSSNWIAWREELKMYDFEHFLPGTILLAFHLEQHSGKHEMTDHHTVSTLHNAPDVIHKMRPMIIVSQHARSYVCVPMFTHNGRGLDRKPNKDEYVSVYDSRLNDYVAERHGLSCHRPLIAKMDPESKCLSDVSCAFLAYPVSHHYKAPIAMIGRLEKDSTKRLLKLYQDFSLKARLDWWDATRPLFRRFRFAKSAPRPHTVSPSNANSPLTPRFETLGCKPADTRVEYGNVPRSDSSSTFGSVPLLGKPKILQNRKTEMPLAQEAAVMKSARKTSIQLHKVPQEVTTVESKVQTIHHEEGEIIEDEDILMEISDGESPFSDKFSV